MPRKAPAAMRQIGQLLTQSGFVNDETLQEALQSARARKLPVGTVLQAMGCLTQQQLRAAIEAQSYLNDRIVSQDLAVCALLKAVDAGVPFGKALEILGWKPRSTPSPNQLGQLLTDAGWITDEQLSECLAASLETGTPLGRVLLFKGLLTQEHLLAAVRAQRVVREELIPRDDAVNALKEVKRRSISLEESLEESGLLKQRTQRETPAGFLLVEAGFVKEVEFMTAAEQCLIDGQTLIETLVAQKLISRLLAQACNTLQKLIDQGVLSKELAPEVLKTMREQRLAASQAVARVGYATTSPATRKLTRELVVLSGIARAKEKMPELAANATTFSQLQQALLMGDRTEAYMIDALAHSLYMIEHKMLTVEDAVMGLHYCLKHRISFDDALNRLGWKRPRAVASG